MTGIIPLYAWTMTAQQWSSDSYYVASNSPKHVVTVVATTKQEAIDETFRLMGPADRYRHWKVWAGGAKDLRLMTAAEKEASA